jgi:hypothetical protein
MYFYTSQTVLLRDYLKIATIVKKLDGDKYLCSYYDENNKFKYIIITEMDVMDEKEYEIYRQRMNSINELLKD